MELTSPTFPASSHRITARGLAFRPAVVEALAGANVFAEPLTGAAARIEATAAEGDWTRCGELVGELSAEQRTLHAAIANLT